MRSVVVWVPLFVLYATLPFVYDAAGTLAALATLLVIALGHAAFVALAIWKPERGPQDRLLGTRLVPR